MRQYVWRRCSYPYEPKGMQASGHVDTLPTRWLNAVIVTTDFER